MKGEQIDKGPLRKFVTKGQKKTQKKIHRKYIRQQSKDINKENPQSNRYDGWTV